MSLKFNPRSALTSKLNPKLKRTLAAQGKGAKIVVPNDLPEKFRFILVSKDYKYNREKGKTTETKSTYCLPIPDGISDNVNLQYADTNLGAVIGALASTVGDVADDTLKGKTAYEAGKSMAQSIASKVKEASAGVKSLNGKDAVTAAGVIAQDLLKSPAAGAVGAVTGIVPNPNATLFFKGVSLKKYSFSWKIYPQSVQEADSFQQFLYRLRSEAMPTKSLNGLGLTYPHEFHIKVLSGGAENLTLFKPAFCTSINIGYAPGGVAFAEDGRAIGYNLTLAFQEIDIWTREDYDVVKVAASPSNNKIVPNKVMGGASTDLSLDEQIPFES